jgi:LacI family transcriptional regulator
MLQKPLYDMPDAIFAANDLLALGLLQALVADGRLSVPHDISLIGFDDIAFAEAAAVPLSSMRQPSRDIGRTALRILLEEVEEPTLPPRQTVYIPQLIARASTRR